MAIDREQFVRILDGLDRQLREARDYEFSDEPECNGICLTAADIGLPEFSRTGEVAYAHPDCPLHGDPIPEDSDEYVCSAGEEEDLRFVRYEDVSQ